MISSLLDGLRGSDSGTMWGSWVALDVFALFYCFRVHFYTIAKLSASWSSTHSSILHGSWDSFVDSLHSHSFAGRFILCWYVLASWILSMHFSLRVHSLWMLIPDCKPDCATFVLRLESSFNVARQSVTNYGWGMSVPISDGYKNARHFLRPKDDDDGNYTENSIYGIGQRYVNLFEKLCQLNANLSWCSRAATNTMGNRLSDLKA